MGLLDPDAMTMKLADFITNAQTDSWFMLHRPEPAATLTAKTLRMERLYGSTAGRRLSMEWCQLLCRLDG
jgi:hypothetical protein